MALYDEPPHSVDLYALTNSTDTGNAEKYVYTLVASGVACSINTGGSTVRSQFDQDQFVEMGQIAFLTETLGANLPQRGWKAIDQTDGTKQGDTLLFTGGIRSGREMEGIPEFTYLEVEAWR